MRTHWNAGSECDQAFLLLLAGWLAGCPPSGWEGYKQNSKGAGWAGLGWARLVLGWSLPSSSGYDYGGISLSLSHEPHCTASCKQGIPMQHRQTDRQAASPAPRHPTQQPAEEEDEERWGRGGGAKGEKQEREGTRKKKENNNLRSSSLPPSLHLPPFEREKKRQRYE